MCVLNRRMTTEYDLLYIANHIQWSSVGLTHTLEERLGLKNYINIMLVILYLWIL